MTSHNDHNPKRRSCAATYQSIKRHIYNNVTQNRQKYPYFAKSRLQFCLQYLTNKDILPKNQIFNKKNRLFSCLVLKKALNLQVKGYERVTNTPKGVQRLTFCNTLNISKDYEYKDKEGKRCE